MTKVVLSCVCALIATVLLTCASPSLLGASSSRCTQRELLRLERVPPSASLRGPAELVPDGDGLRVAVFNIRSGFGPDDDRSQKSVEARLERIATALATAPPLDVIGLNEVDFRSRRTAFVDQAQFIANELEQAGHHYRVVRGPAWLRDTPGREVQYGNALLIRHPILRTRRCGFSNLSECDALPLIDDLPQASLAAPWSWLSHEPRGVALADFEWRGHEVRAIVTHLDPYSAQARETQAAQIIAGLIPPEGSVVLLGDMNSVPTPLTVDRRWFSADRTHDVLTSGRLFDLRAELADDDRGGWSRWATYPSDAPRWALDGVFASTDLASADLKAFGHGLSDHLGLVGTLVPVTDGAALAARHERHARRRRSRLERLQRCDLPEAGESSFFAWLRTIGGATPHVETARVEGHTP